MAVFKGIDIIPGFVHRAGNHCVTSALGAGLRTVGVDQPEEVLFGLGRGLGGAYFEIKNLLPFLGGRCGGRNGDFETAICQALGVPIHVQSSRSAVKVTEWVKSELSGGRAAVVYVDMAYLPYADFPPGQHFGGHVVAIVGYSSEKGAFVVADRFEEPAILLKDDFIEARISKYPPFPAIGTQVFLKEPSNFTVDLAPAMKSAIKSNMEVFLNPPIKNIGVSATAKFASEVTKWERKFDKPRLAASLMNIYIYIEVGGTGGAAFRRMYSRFLHRASRETGIGAIEEAGVGLAAIADEWTAMASLCKDDAQRVESGKSPVMLNRISEIALSISQKEKSVLQPLLSI